MQQGQRTPRLKVIEEPAQRASIVTARETYMSTWKDDCCEVLLLKAQCPESNPKLLSLNRSQQS